MINKELIKILICPETKLPLELADGDLISTVNSKISSGSFKNKAGKLITDPIEEALITSNRKNLYIIKNGIPLLLVEEAISL